MGTIEDKEYYNAKELPPLFLPNPPQFYNYKIISNRYIWQGQGLVGYLYPAIYPPGRDLKEPLV
jgi:hypothetical protein